MNSRGEDHYWPVPNFGKSGRLQAIMVREQLFVEASDSETLEQWGFRGYPDFLTPDGASEISRVRDRTVYFLPPATPGKPGAYLKVFHNPGANRPWLQLLHLEKPHSQAEAESRRLLWLAQHHFLAPRVMAWGARISGIREINSFLLTEELSGLEPMDVWLQQNEESPTAERDSRLKRRFLQRCAEVLSSLHGQGFDHPFPYLRHFFVPSYAHCRDSSFHPAEEIPVAVLDVHCAEIRSSVSPRNRARALTEALISSLKSPLTQSDRLFFFSTYCGGNPDRNLFDRVFRRLRTKMKHHPTRYRWVREKLLSMPFPESFRKLADV
ncbi:MAG: hypothetical protein KJ050_10705 [Candidatus Omnitrophica bacterium]|nr:hypothetical protein [Candidatus Omnitrophota bacterium]